MKIHDAFMTCSEALKEIESAKKKVFDNKKVKNNRTLWEVQKFFTGFDDASKFIMLRDLVTHGSTSLQLQYKKGYFMEKAKEFIEQS